MTIDHEIFRLRDEILAHEGPDVNFYGMTFFQSSTSSANNVGPRLRRCEA